jgi:hypothetical protein
VQFANRFDKSLAERCYVLPISHSQAVPAIAAHYLKKFPAVNPLIMGLFCDCFIYGIAVFSFPPRQTEKRYGCKVWEFSRLWVSDKMPRNTESWFVSRCLNFIKLNHVDVKKIVTYADPSAGHDGTLYRACNFYQDGMTDEGRKTPRSDYYIDGAKIGRKSHALGRSVERRPRVSKKRFVYRLQKCRKEL